MLCGRLQEKHVLEMQCKHQRNILELQEKLKLNLQQVLLFYPPHLRALIGSLLIMFMVLVCTFVVPKTNAVLLWDY